MQAYSAGFLEGHVTRDLIDMHWQNTYKGYCKMPLSKFCQELQKYMDENVAWMQQQIDKKSSHEPYWHHVSMKEIHATGFKVKIFYLLRVLNYSLQ